MAENSSFVPVRDSDLTDDQKSMVALIENDWQYHPIVENYHGLMEEWIAFFEGNQYCFWNTHTKRLEQVEALVNREIKNVYNRIYPMIRQQWSEMRYQHEFFVEPTTREADDIKGAHLSSALIEFTNVLRKFDHKINFAKLWALVTGCVFWKEWWNKNLNGYVAGKDGKPVVEKGDCDYNWVSPFNVRPDPLGKSRDEWRYFIEGKAVATKSLEEEFNMEKGSVSADPMSKIMTTMFLRSDLKYPREPMTIRKEYWEVPSPKYPNGRFIVSGGGWIFWDKKNPTPNAAIPYFQLFGLHPILEDVWGESAVRIAQETQIQINRVGSLIDEHIQYYKTKAMIPEGALKQNDLRAFTRAGVDYVFFTPTGYGNPYYQNPPPIPEQYFQWLPFLQNEMEYETSVRKTMQGQLPKYASRPSEALFKGLLEQDVKNLYPAIQDQETQLCDAMQLRLELMQKHYTLPRMVKITGKNKETEVAYVKKEDIKGNTDVRIRSGVDIFETRRAKQEVVEAMLQKGLISDPKKALELMDVKGVAEYLEEEYVDERQAHRIIELYKQGKPYIAVSPDDNHTVGYRVFNNFRKMEEFALSDPACQAKILKRIEEHKMFLQEEQPQAQPQAQPNPAVANAPEAPGTFDQEELAYKLAQQMGVGGGGGQPAIPPELMAAAGGI